MPPRRFTTFVFIVAVTLTVVLLFSSSSREIASAAAEKVKTPETLRANLPNLPKFDVPDFRISWYKSAHKPPQQQNSTSGDTSWHSDWRWMNPFSSSVTLDEDRAVLPHVLERPQVYTYYDTTAKRDKETKEADQELLLTWRRAWWAKGFRPVILSEAEAMNHPLYQSIKPRDLPNDLEFEFMRFLAWGHMGSGLLASWHCVPMSAYDDVLLSHLRRGQYAQLTNFEGLNAGLFAGEKIHVNNAIQDALNDAKLSTYKTITEAISKEHWKTEQPGPIAHYDSKTIKDKYPALDHVMEESPAKGKRELNQMIDAHLHTVWQNTFSSGISVLKPLPAHSTTLVEPVLDLAHLLTECPESIMQSSCPPNRPKCSPCVASKMHMNTPQAFKNSSTVFTLSVVPHPLTMITLNNDTVEHITTKHIRRHTDRDQWVLAVTRDLLGDGRGGPSRVVSVKDIVASEFGSSRSLWFTTEQFPSTFHPPPPPPKSPTNDAHPEPERIKPFPEEWLEDLDWVFGFSIPRTTIAHGESLPPVPGPERWRGPAGLPEEKHKSSDPKPPSDEQKSFEAALLRRARDTVESKDENILKLRAVAEAWNLADTEAWKFVKAFRARAILERTTFEKEEAKFGGSRARGASRWWKT
ncbi:uncharacterized protein HMPREF1541_02344 [Cyphellophora europaea CBS 101466]|uniref:Glycosyl transferase CAP10 domain-containing protein n=1 Tax=Cyphellophora europaea (strain CBS 101466) TaxID=1220924 RepID=W2S394_CYPE1|nr:uncharacterized protein HMPREF1541_02344 [Cyphellophora europaea CBS 101466]ETN43186.1 hypothetical protein HMPREF1541_02344 [Cyphellophora europaea CBS 101466]